jgi:hypothetical protein
VRMFGGMGMMFGAGAAIRLATRTPLRRVPWIARRIERGATDSRPGLTHRRPDRLPVNVQARAPLDAWLECDLEHVRPSKISRLAKLPRRSREIVSSGSPTVIAAARRCARASFPVVARPLAEHEPILAQAPAADAELRQVAGERHEQPVRPNAGRLSAAVTTTQRRLEEACAGHPPDGARAGARSPHEAAGRA